MQLVLLPIMAVLIVIVALFGGATINEISAGPAALVSWGPDEHGVVCYSKGGSNSSSNLSCVKVN